MKKQPQYLMPMPDRYRDGSFDVVTRDASSAVIFWDLAHEATVTDTDARLAVRYCSADGEFGNQLTLHDYAGHLLLPLQHDDRDYLIELGWLSAGSEFTTVGAQNITLPETPLNHPRQSGGATSRSPSSMRHPRYALLAAPVERRGFRPGLVS